MKFGRQRRLGRPGKFSLARLPGPSKSPSALLAWLTREILVATRLFVNGCGTTAGYYSTP